MNQRELFQAALNFASPFPQDLLQLALEQAELVEFQKGEYLTKQGEQERYIYIVQSGVQRVYLETEKGEFNLIFAHAPSLSGSPDSLISQSPSLFHVQALTLSQIWRLPALMFHENLHRLEFSEWRRQVVEFMLIGRLQREVELGTLNAEDRYINFRQRSEYLFDQISYKHLASYLQMSPETFSRIHKKFLTKSFS